MSPGKGARRLLSADGGVWSLNIAIVIASVALLAGPVQHLPEFDAGVHLPWWGLALGFLAAERCVVHLHFRRSAHSFSLGDLPLVFGLLFATPIDLVIAGLVGPIVVLLIDRRLPAIKVVFNIAQFTLATCLAVIVFHVLAATADGFGPAVWLYALLATQISAFVTVLLIACAISISEGLLGAKALGRMLLMDLTVTITNSSLALAAAVIVVYEPRALPLLIVPLVTVFLAYRAYATERQRHESLEFLYETTRTLSRSPEIVGALEGLLARSVEAFRAEIAEIVLFPSEGNAPLRTTHGPGDVRDEMLPIDTAIADELRALVDHDEPVTRLTPDDRQRAPAPLPGGARRHPRDARDAPGGDARRRHDAAGQPPRRRPRLLRRRPAPVRDARHQRLGRAPVRPPRADRLAAARAPAPARAPGLPRLR